MAAEVLTAATLASVNAGGQIGLLSPISFCHWQPDETTTIGHTIWSNLFKAAQIAIAVYNAIKQEEIADKELDLAESWHDHALYKWNRFKNYYVPLEKKLLNEVSTAPKPKLNCKNAQYRAEQSTASSYASMRKFFDNNANKYNLCISDNQQTTINLQQNILLTDSINYNYADDRWYRDFKDDKRWSRRSNILNLGRNLDSTALTYGRIASNIYGAVGTQYDRFAQSASYALGYFGARNDTYMPFSKLGMVKTNIETPIGGLTPTTISPTSGGIANP